jgi:aldose 1-epimerase
MALEVVTLRDESTGSSAKVLTGYGFNCYQFQANCGGEPIEVLWSAPNFESGQERPSHSGIPILFPFPGRIRGTTFKFRGGEYPLEPGDALGNAIHGFVLNRPWQVIEQSPQRVVGRFRASQVDPSLLTRWPADFELTVAYHLNANTLHSEIEVVNPDDKPLPMGLGTHPYFRLPLGQRGNAEACRVTVPAGEYWELRDMMATGRRLPVDAEKDLRGGMEFSRTKFDNVFSELEFSDGMCRTSIEDPGSGRRLQMIFGDEFPACVVYNPPHREAICIEPYTCIPDAFRLEEAGIDAGALVLQPGERWKSRIDIRVD